MLKKVTKFSALVLLLVMFSNVLFSQETQDSSSSNEIIIYNSDNTKIIKDNNIFIRHLNGNVKIYHDSTFFFADTAILKGKQLFAFGNIIIIQNDSLHIYSDTINYNGDSLKSELIGKVLLQNGEKELKTQHLYYDVHNKIGRYETGAKIIQRTSELTSVHGVYYVKENKINFNEYVAIQDSSFILHTDSLDFDSDKRIAYFLGPTLIELDSSVIYCEDGYFDIKNGDALFEKNMTYKKNDANATADQLFYNDSLSTYTLVGNAKYSETDINSSADTIIHDTKRDISTLIGNAIFDGKDQHAIGEKIIYNHKTESFIAEGRSTINDAEMQITSDNTNYSKKSGKGIASGNVEFVDTVSNIMINSSKMFLERKNDYMLAYGDTVDRLLVMFVDKTDTTYMSSDTLLSFNIINGIDTVKVLKAYNNVKIYNKDYQAIADSLNYFPDDSLYVLYNNPVLWSDSTQITGDTISIFSKNGGIDKIYSRNNGFITNLVAINLYNQIKGIRVISYFEHDSISRMDVDGNAETIYHMEDDKEALTGTVKTVCSKIGFDFKNNDIQNIKFYGVPKSDFIPIKLEIVNPHFLDGFKWLEEYRPKVMKDILVLKKIKIPTGTDVEKKKEAIIEEDKIDSKKPNIQPNVDKSDLKLE